MRIHPLLPLLFLPVLTQAAETSPGKAPTGVLHFEFGTQPSAEGRVQVSPTSEYTPSVGWGFDLGTLPGTSLPDAFEGKGSPFLFSVALPEGSYRVTVRVGSDSTPSENTIKAESRQLMVEKLVTAAGEHRDLVFSVHIRTPRLAPPPLNAPGGTEVILNEREKGVLHWDDKLTLEFNGAHPVLDSLIIEPAKDSPVLYLVGDSTVTDQPGEPAASWGQMLPRFLTENVAVSNHAESGETLKSFLTAHRLDKVLENMRTGDFLFIQFGHNDSKTQWPQTYADPATTYPAYLRIFITEARRRGAIPVLVTSMHRRRFDAQGRVIDTHGGYPEAVRKVAAELQVPLIDLHALSRPLYEALGPENSALAFTDATHHNNYGGYELARCVASEIRRQIPELARFLRPEAGPFDPSKPDDPKAFHMPASPTRMKAPPRGN